VSAFVVRPATVEDAAGIARVHIEAWRETYSRLVEQGEFDDLSIERRTERWSRIIDSGESQVWVAETAGAIVGFSSSASRDSAAPRPLELESIYLLGDQHGSGAGQALLDAAIGDSSAFLMVAEGNPRAREFYRRNRFELDGYCEDHPLVRTPVACVRMVR
jgi:L-amino acid N-acyltransferase YncA